MIVNSMDFEEAKEKLKVFLLRHDYEIDREETEDVFFRGYENAISKLTKDNIESYIQSQEFIATLQNIPVESSICNLDYREQRIAPIHPKMSYSSFDQHPVFFGDKSKGGTYIEIGEASNNYVYFFVDKEKPRLKEKLRFFYGQKIQYTDILDQMVKPTTIKIYNMRKSNIEEAISYSNSMFETCLFELSYTQDLHLFLTNEISYYDKMRKNFSLKEHMSFESHTNRKLPYLIYNSDLVRFYQRGVGTDIPSLQFLAFYQVLEYFY